MCGSTAFVAKTPHVPSVSTAFAALMLPLPCVFHCLRGVGTTFALRVGRYTNFSLAVADRLPCQPKPGGKVVIARPPDRVGHRIPLATR